MAKAEISWRRVTQDGRRLHVYAQHVGKRWKFFAREKRYDQWEPIEKPEVEDWLDLLDSVRRRVARLLLRPEEIDRLKKTISELHPGTPLE